MAETIDLVIQNSSSQYAIGLVPSINQTEEENVAAALKTIERSLQNGEYICARDAKGNTPLHVAIEKKDVRVVERIMCVEDGRFKHKNVGRCLKIKNLAGKSPKEMIQDMCEASPESQNDTLSWQRLFHYASGKFDLYYQDPNPLHGFIFQVKLQMLLVKSTADKDDEFTIGHEMSEALPFDDIVIRYGPKNNKKIRFYQAKHKANPQNLGEKIKLDDLLKTDKPLGPFSLKKYYAGFCKMVLESFSEDSKSFFKDKINEIHELIIITNGDFDKETKASNNSLKIEWADFSEIIDYDKSFVDEYASQVKVYRFKNDDTVIVQNGQRVKQEGRATQKIKGALAKLFKASVTNPNIDMFFEKMIFIMNFPSENDLDKLIEQKVGGIFNLLDANFLKNSYQNDVIEMVKCCKQEIVRFYSRNDWDNYYNSMNRMIFTLRISGLSIDYIKYIESFDIEFTSDFQSKIGQLFEDNDDGHSISYLIVSTKCVLLTTIKVRRTINALKNETKYDFMKKDDGCIFIRSIELLKKPDEKLVELFLSSDKSCRLLIVRCHSIEEFSQVVALCRNQSIEMKIILIVDEEQFKSISNTFNDSNKINDVQIAFNDLTTDSKNKIMQNEVRFQGTESNLSRLVDDRTASEVIDSIDLSQIIADQKIEIGRIDPFSSTGFKKDYYIDRRFWCEGIGITQFPLVRHLKSVETIFLITSVGRIEDLPLILCKKEDVNYSCVSLRSLNEIYKSKDKLDDRDEFYSVNQWADGAIYENGVVIAVTDTNQTEEEIFRKMCDSHKNKSIQWLQYSNWNNPITVRCKLSKSTISAKGFLQYRGTKGDPPMIAVSYILDNFTLESIITLNRKVVIVSNDPGFGKSTFLVWLANQFRNHRDQNDSIVKWVVRIDLMHYAKKEISNGLDEYEFDSSGDAKRFISNIALKESNEKSFEARLFEQFNNVVLLIDGFDEICPTHKTKTIKLIKQLKENPNIAQLWITTRTCEQKYLVEALHVPPFILSAFGDDDQYEFLVKYWNYQLRQKPTSETGLHLSENRRKETLRRHAVELIGTIPENDNYRTVPLTLKMLADLAFVNGFKLNAMNFVDVYEQFIDLFLKLYGQYKCQRADGVPASDFVFTLFVTVVRRIHKALAFKYIFPEENISYFQSEIDEYQKNIKLSDTEFQREMNRVGLLKRDSLEFIHKTFAEYLVSQYIIENLDDNKNILPLLHKIVTSDDYNTEKL